MYKETFLYSYKKIKNDPFTYDKIFFHSFYRLIILEFIDLPPISLNGYDKLY